MYWHIPDTVICLKNVSPSLVVVPVGSCERVEKNWHRRTCHYQVVQKFPNENRAYIIKVTFVIIFVPTVTIMEYAIYSRRNEVLLLFIYLQQLQKEPVQARKWSRPTNDPQIGPQMIPGPEMIPAIDTQKIGNGVDSMNYLWMYNYSNWRKVKRLRHKSNNKKRLTCCAK